MIKIDVKVTITPDTTYEEWKREMEYEISREDFENSNERGNSFTGDLFSATFKLEQGIDWIKRFFDESYEKYLGTEHNHSYRNQMEAVLYYITDITPSGTILNMIKKALQLKREYGLVDMAIQVFDGCDEYEIPEGIDILKEAMPFNNRYLDDYAEKVIEQIQMEHPYLYC